MIVSDAPGPLGKYPHARRVGNLLFLSGLGPRNPENNSVPGLVYDQQGNLVDYDIAQQCHAVFRNVKAVLKSCGAGLKDLADITVFLTDLERDFDTYNRIYAEYFGNTAPCRTTVGVRSLPGEIAIEVKCIAWTSHEE